jgi:hypothetical protein
MRTGAESKYRLVVGISSDPAMNGEARRTARPGHTTPKNLTEVVGAGAAPARLVRHATAAAHTTVPMLNAKRAKLATPHQAGHLQSSGPSRSWYRQSHRWQPRSAPAHMATKEKALLRKRTKPTSSRRPGVTTGALAGGSLAG